ncbi:MAG: dTMP kinase [Brevundimonas sp.]|uniref:Thymidylate kinase n=1 Tax=Brevundimonas albigilva TaxID=1312364 RepID=A0ABY4SJB1_9CAUL|nr:MULTISPECIES: dTMP kinase [Brevundimonas]PZU61973.1 MAG: dTMP kinase [Brevundimonas sp.]UQV18069.1 dTMP kinase [Brevundimonas albigilva]URI13941.1 dTMP kinase [Brevundimonas albigilva]
MSRGKFITFEGGEGAGKSTQVGRLVARLQPLLNERAVVRTREPGGSKGAEVIRNLVVATEAEPWSAMTETLLMYAARSDHLENTIRPALAAGDWVVCDRFADSSRAYQGAGGGVAPGFIEQVDAAVVGDDQPDLTLVFDLPVEVGLERAFGRGLFETRFESKGLAFHQRLREGFLKIVETNPARCVRIDAVGDLDTVEERVWRAVQERLL